MPIVKTLTPLEFPPLYGSSMERYEPSLPANEETLGGLFDILHRRATRSSYTFTTHCGGHARVESSEEDEEEANSHGKVVADESDNDEEEEDEDNENDLIG